MSKQTAVEWLETELKKLPMVDVVEVFKEAKAMEKEQIKEAFVSGSHFEYEFQNSENYYNETYKNNS